MTQSVTFDYDTADLLSSSAQAIAVQPPAVRHMTQVPPVSVPRAVRVTSWPGQSVVFFSDTAYTVEYPSGTDN